MLPPPARTNPWSSCLAEQRKTRPPPRSRQAALHGTYHRLGLRAAAALAGPNATRILSARFGLVPLHHLIEPYNLRLGQPGSITAERLREQAADQGLLDHRNVVLFGGRDYTTLAQQVWPHAHTPLAGTKGIGEQQKRLAEIAACGQLH